MRSPPILKLPRLRCVCAPQYWLAGTSMGPKVSVSMRVAGAWSVCVIVLFRLMPLVSAVSSLAAPVNLFCLAFPPAWPLTLKAPQLLGIATARGLRSSRSDLGQELSDLLLHRIGVLAERRRQPSTLCAAVFVRAAALYTVLMLLPTMAVLLAASLAHSAISCVVLTCWPAKAALPVRLWLMAVTVLPTPSRACTASATLCWIADVLD